MLLHDFSPDGAMQDQLIPTTAVAASKGAERRPKSAGPQGAMQAARQLFEA